MLIVKKNRAIKYAQKKRDAVLGAQGRRNHGTNQTNTGNPIQHKRQES